MTVPPVTEAPVAFEVTQLACTVNLNAYPVDLGWDDTTGETGSRLHRTVALLASLGSNASSHSDQAPKASDVIYELEAFNALGKSGRAPLSVPTFE